MNNILKLGVIITMIILLVCSVVGCQNTPKQKVIQSKGGDLNDVINALPTEEYVVEVPATWKHRLSSRDGLVFVEIDADIELPEIDEYPIVQVEKIDLTEAWLKDFIIRLSNGKKVYDYKDENKYTKHEIEEIIISLKRELADLTSGSNSGDTTEQERIELLREKEAIIATWEEYYKEAPEVFEHKEKIVKYSPDNNGTLQFYGSVDLGKNEMAYVNVSKTDEGGYVIINNRDDNVGELVGSSTILSNLNNITTSVDDAINVGKDFLKMLGEDDFEPALILSGYMRDLNNLNAKMDELPQCYHIYFTRSVEGVHTTYRNTKMDAFLLNGRMSEKIAVMEQYAPFWPQESIEMLITDSGVNYFRWEMPTKQTEVLSSNVQVLPFDEIQRIFEEQMLIEGIWTNPADANIISREIVINKVVLGMMQVRQKDTYDGLIMIPTWNFYGYENCKYEEHTESIVSLDKNNLYAAERFEGHSFLTINAIDGSIINPVLGY